MARKGNQQKNGLDRNSVNHKTKVTESCNGSLPGERERLKAHESEVLDGKGVSHSTQSESSLGERGNKVKHAGERKKSNRKSQNLSKEKPAMDRMPSSTQPASMSSNSGDTEKDISASNASELREDDQISKSPRDSSVPFEYGLPNVDVMEEVSGFSESLVARNLRASALSILKAARIWLEKQKPLFIKMTTFLYDSGKFLRHRSEEAYPIIWKWLVGVGNLMLLLVMVWLDCSLRGLISIFHLGTTSIFTNLWCSILSIIAMAGISKFLMITVVGTLLAVFVGFTLAVLVITILATVVLWMYGSFWTTGLLISVGGLGFALSYERFALFITTVYSIYCAKIYVGWLGLLVGLNLSFISSDVLMHFLKSNINEHNRPDKPQKKTSGMRGQPGSFFSEPETVFEKSTDHSAGVASTSGFDVDFNSEDEVVRLLNCTDHYSALGLTRYVDIDVSLLKREYRRKAMLVHPDKNMGNEKAAEAFKKLQNAYEILLDSLKRKTYDEELKGEELLNSFRRFQSTSHQNGRHGPFSTGFARSEADGDGDLRRITCKKCGNLHNWIHTDKSKSRARWCQDCRDFHQAKDGDGWVEQSSQPFLFGLLQKVDIPSAYVCAESRIYDATEWFICQGMRCPANTHKPSFHVNTSITSKYGGATKGSGGSGQRGAAGIPMTDLDESMTEEELMEWFQKAMQSGMFERSSPSGGESPLSATAGNFSKNGPSSSSNSKKKKKGKKQR